LINKKRPHKGIHRYNAASPPHPEKPGAANLL
jgi:hypothetical protein